MIDCPLSRYWNKRSATILQRWAPFMAPASAPPILFETSRVWPAFLALWSVGGSRQTTCSKLTYLWRRWGQDSTKRAGRRWAGFTPVRPRGLNLGQSVRLACIQLEPASPTWVVRGSIFYRTTQFESDTLGYSGVAEFMVSSFYRQVLKSVIGSKEFLRE